MNHWIYFHNLYIILKIYNYIKTEVADVIADVVPTAPWAPSRVDMCALQIFIIIIIIISNDFPAHL